MFGKHIIRRIGVATLAAAFALVLAAPAQADWPAQADSSVRPDDRAIHGPGAITLGVPDAPIRPDDRADRSLPDTGFEGSSGTGLIVGDDKQNVQVGVNYYRRFELPQELGREPTQIVSTGDGFDWGDAGLGAAAAFGVALLALAAALSLRGGRRLRRA
jgi:hypothetical protein